MGAKLCFFSTACEQQFEQRPKAGSKINNKKKLKDTGRCPARNQCRK
jgi:hypothetical protein